MPLLRQRQALPARAQGPAAVRRVRPPDFDRGRNAVQARQAAARDLVPGHLSDHPGQEGRLGDGPDAQAGAPRRGLPDHSLQKNADPAEGCARTRSRDADRRIRSRIIFPIRAFRGPGRQIRRRRGQDRLTLGYNQETFFAASESFALFLCRARQEKFPLAGAEVRKCIVDERPQVLTRRQPCMDAPGRFGIERRNIDLSGQKGVRATIALEC